MTVLSPMGGASWPTPFQQQSRDRGLSQTPGHEHGPSAHPRQLQEKRKPPLMLEHEFSALGAKWRVLGFQGTPLSSARLPGPSVGPSRPGAHPESHSWSRSSTEFQVAMSPALPVSSRWPCLQPSHRHPHLAPQGRQPCWPGHVPSSEPHTQLPAPTSPIAPLVPAPQRTEPSQGVTPTEPRSCHHPTCARPHSCSAAAALLYVKFSVKTTGALSLLLQS